MRGPCRNMGGGIADEWSQGHYDEVAAVDFDSNSNSIQIIPNFDRSKKDLPELEKFEIKYGCEGFEEGNNFLHRNFFRFDMNCI
jgi:hypothetical protein